MAETSTVGRLAEKFFQDCILGKRRLGEGDRKETKGEGG